MYTERYSLPFLAGVLISALERRRPGLGPWTAATREELKKIFDAELAEMRRRFFELFDDKSYWERVEKSLVDTCFPRYCALAEKQTQLEGKDYGLWRGGDLIARGTYAGAGLVIGILMVKLPFIPIPQTWDLFAFATMLGAPLIPDVQVWLHKRRYRKGLEAVVKDMKEAEDQLKLYQPLQEIAGPRPAAVEAVDSNLGVADRGRNGGIHG